MRLILCATIEFAVLGCLAFVRAKLWTYGSDTGTFAQIVADAFHGMRNGVEAGSHFRYHWSPTLALLWPLVAISGSALALQLLQAAATAACGPLVAAIARPYAGKALADSLGFVTLIYPPLIALGFDEFHELGLFTPLVLALFLFADRRQWLWFSLSAIATVGLREDAALTLAFFGIVLAVVAWRSSQTNGLGRGLLEGYASAPRALGIAGIGLALASVAALATYYGIIAPRFGGWKPSHFYVYSFANGPLALALAPFARTLPFVRAIFTVGRLTYVLEAVVPLAFLPLFSRWALLALPGAAVVLLANSGYVWRMGDHYAALWIPWLLVGAIMGTVTLLQRGSPVASRWVQAAGAMCVVFLVAFDPMHPLHYLHRQYDHLADARQAIACVPKDAPLATHDEWFSAIAARRPHATIDRTKGIAYLVYADDFPNNDFQRYLRPAIATEVARGRYRIICRYGRVNAYEAARSR